MGNCAGFRAFILVLIAASGALYGGVLRAQAPAERNAGETNTGATAECPNIARQAVVFPLPGPAGNSKADHDGSFPDTAAWEAVSPVVFCADWRGQNADAGRKTEVQLLWSRQALHLRFRAQFRSLDLYPTKNRRQEKLWLRDVAEVFLQPAGTAEGYKEFEISPNGDWLAINIFSEAQGRFSRLDCDVKSRGTVDESQHVWTAEIAIPMKCLTADFDPGANWRVNFFRIEGMKPDRFFSAWHPTNTPQPYFHVPEAFGELRFAIE